MRSLENGAQASEVSDDGGFFLFKGKKVAAGG